MKTYIVTHTLYFGKIVESEIYANEHYIDNETHVFRRVIDGNIKSALIYAVGSVLNVKEKDDSSLQLS